MTGNWKVERSSKPSTPPLLSVQCLQTRLVKILKSMTQLMGSVHVVSICMRFHLRSAGECASSNVVTVILVAEGLVVHVAQNGRAYIVCRATKQNSNQSGLVVYAHGSDQPTSARRLAFQLKCHSQQQNGLIESMEDLNARCSNSKTVTEEMKKEIETYLEKKEDKE